MGCLGPWGSALSRRQQRHTKGWGEEPTATASAGAPAPISPSAVWAPWYPQERGGEPMLRLLGDGDHVGCCLYPARASIPSVGRAWTHRSGPVEWARRHAARTAVAPEPLDQPQQARAGIRRLRMRPGEGNETKLHICCTCVCMHLTSGLCRLCCSITTFDSPLQSSGKVRRPSPPAFHLPSPSLPISFSSQTVTRTLAVRFFFFSSPRALFSRSRLHYVLLFACFSDPCVLLFPCFFDPRSIVLLALCPFSLLFFSYRFIFALMLLVVVRRKRTMLKSLRLDDSSLIASLPYQFFCRCFCCFCGC